MKGLKRWLLPLLTLLLIGAGAGMPWAAARVQDRYGISALETMPFDPVSLTLRKDSEIGAVLRLMSRPYELTDWKGETRMQRDDVCMAAFDALMQLDDRGLLEAGYIRPFDYVESGALDRMKENQMCDAWPELLTAQDGTSTIIWVCWWTDPAGPQYQLLVDDATGLAVSGYIPCPNVPSPEGDMERMEQWMLFFTDYYGIEIQDRLEGIYDASSEFRYFFDPEDGLGTCGLSVHIYTFEMDFGVCDAEELVPLPAEAYGWDTEAEVSFNLSVR